jgi:hypothetical protein
MQPPTTSYPPWLQRRQHGSSTSGKSHVLLPIPGWAVKTCHCTRHVRYYSTTDPPRGRTRRLSYPKIPGARPYLFPVDPPRPTAGQQRSKACTPQDPGSFHHPILYVTMVPRDGWPFPEHVATAASTAPDKTSLLRHHPGVSAFS